MNNEKTDMMTVGEVAARLGVSRSRVYQLASSHTIPSVRYGKAIRIPRIAWERWLLAQTELALNGTCAADVPTTAKTEKGGDVK